MLPRTGLPAVAAGCGRLGAALALGVCLAYGAPSWLTPRMDCTDLKGKTIPATAIALRTKGATITGAKLVDAASAPADKPWAGTPEYCDLTGTIAPADSQAPGIQFRISVPTAWNEKAWQVGGGGLNGVVPQTASLRLMPAPSDTPSLLAQGYAVFGSDSGHPLGNSDWIVNQEAWTNFAYEQLKKTHDVTLWVLNYFYGTKVKLTYFSGASQGGREALEVVSRYPADYAGVYAAVPLAYFAGLLIDPTVKGVAQLAPGAWLPPAKAAVVKDEILRLCDALDGSADGVIHNYSACQKLVDPTVTPNPFARIRCASDADTGNQCLSDAQLATLGGFYSPLKFGYPLANGESDWPGWGVGMEGARGWLLSATQPDASKPAAFNAGIGATVQRGRLGGNQDFNLLSLDLAKLQKQIQSISADLDVREDWSNYLKNGGKLIMVTGASDYIANPRAQMRLYERVLARAGKAAVGHFMRYYVMPNSGHGLSGVNAKGEALPSAWDPAAALVDWVENGMAPPDAVTLTGADPRPGVGGTASRLMCRYPNYPRYKGTGDLFQASSYTCVAP